MLRSLLLFFLISIINVYGNYELKQVQIVYRHGDRSPVVIFPTDINDVSKWKYGLGELTDIGINQHFDLGLWLRRRYQNFSGPVLNNMNIYVRSSNLDRTLMSAEANLAGLSFNNTNRVIRELAWRPVPIHTRPEKFDYLLETGACPRYAVEKGEKYKNPYFSNKFVKYESTLLYLQNKTGLSDLSFMNIWTVYDTLICEKSHNMTMNTWVTEELWRNITLINNINWELMFYDDLAKLAGGFLLNTIRNNMKQKSRNSTWIHKDSKIMMYSGHDTNVASLAKLLGFYKNMPPPYASCIIFELYKNDKKSDNWAVKMFYKNYSESHGSTSLSPILIPGCSSLLCPLSQFLNVTNDKSMTKEELKKNCGLKTFKWFYIFWILVFLCNVVFVLSIIMVCSCLRKRFVNYSRFGNEKVIN